MDSMKGTVASWSICEINSLGIGWLVHVINLQVVKRSLKAQKRSRHFS